MTIFWHDIIGHVGVGLIVLSYFLLQLNTITSEQLSYSTMNLLGAIFLLISLCYNFNLASVVIEFFWIAISLFGIIKAIKKRFKERSASTQKPRQIR